MSIRERPSLPVPAGADLERVEYAIVVGVLRYDGPPPDHSTSVGNMTDDLLHTLANTSARARTGWFVESRTPNVVRAGYQRRQHYLSVLIHYDEERVRLEVAGSDRLDQSEDSIHRTAETWMTNLEAQIRRSLGRLALASTPGNASN